DEDPATKDKGFTVGVEGPGTDNKRHDIDDESHGIDHKGYSVESDELGLEEEEEAVPGGQQHAASVVRTGVSAPLRLGYGALRCRELALEKDHVYIKFEIGRGSASAPESERPERVSKSRQPTLTRWKNPKDGMDYIDVPAYPPPAPPVQTPPSPEWTFATPTIAKTEGFLIELGAQVKIQRGLIRDHAVRLEELSPTLFERYDRDIRELFTRSGAVRDDIFSYRYRFRSLKHEQERISVMFRALWRPVLALEAWAGRVDTQMTDMSRAGYDDHRLVHDMLLHQTALQRELQEIRGRVNVLEQERDHRER
nr:hypothetical protein [Tanacetum cinerariifolium]